MMFMSSNSINLLGKMTGPAKARCHATNSSCRYSTQTNSIYLAAFFVWAVK